MTKMARHYPVKEVSYAAATYAVATGAKVTRSLLEYRSESQIMIAGAAYAALLDQSWQRVAVAAGCPNEKNKFTSLGEAIKHRRRKGMIDLELFELCKRAVIEGRLVRRSPPPFSPPAPVPVPEVKVTVADLPPIPIRSSPKPEMTTPPPAFSGQMASSRQTWKPQSETDKLIYGTPLNRKIGPVVGLVSVPAPGDKAPDWVAPNDDGPTGAASRSKKATIARIPSLERPLPDE